MVNFQSLKNELKSLNGKTTDIETRRGSLTLKETLVMDYHNDGISICNLNCITEDLNSINWRIKEEDIRDFEVLEVFESKEVRMNLTNGDYMFVIQM